MNSIISSVKNFVADFAATGWEVSYTVRDFRTPRNHRVWFIYPLHTSVNADLLDSCIPEGEVSRPQYSAQYSAKKKKEPKIPKVDQCREAIQLDPLAFRTISDICERFDVSDDTVRRWAKRCGYKIVDGKIIILKEADKC